MTDFKLGQRVIFTHPLKRVGTWDEEKRQAGKAWRHSRYEKKAQELQEGIVIGRRTLANGETQWEEEGTIFHPTEYFQAYLIATALHRKPSVVRVENVRRVPLKWHPVPADNNPALLTPQEVQLLAAVAWLNGAAAGASVDMGYIPSDALTRQLPEHLADQFRALNPYTPREG